MPYTIDNPPDYIKNLPIGAQRVFISAYNSVYEKTEDETKSRMAGWGAVKNKYEQDADGKWVRKPVEGRMNNFRYLSGSIELDEKDKKSRVQILRTGTFYHRRYGKFTITDETLEAMVSNFHDVYPKLPTELVVDFEHLSVSNIVDPRQGRAAGWVKDIELDDSKLYATVEWTEEAVEAITKKEFRFISPQFDLNYPDKESKKKIGPTLLSVALTNRPFLDGMDPVVLSEPLGAMIFAEEESIDERVNVVRSAFYAEFGSHHNDEYVTEVFDDFAIIQSGSELFKIPYTRDSETGKVEFDTLGRVKVTLTKTYDEVQQLSDAERTARETAAKAATKVGTSKRPASAKIIKREGTVDEKELRKILEIGEEDDVAEAITKLKADSAEAKTLRTRVTKLEGEKKTVEERMETVEEKLSDRDATELVAGALAKGKITPKQEEWAKAYALRDAEGFRTFVETAEKVGPELKILGKEVIETDIQLTEAEKKQAEQLGVTEEELIAQKKLEQEQSPAE